MTIVYIKWRDASHSMDEHQIADLGGLEELDEVGFLLKESTESITIGMEHQNEMKAARMWLTIPRVNIVEERRMDLDKAFPPRRKRK